MAWAAFTLAWRGAASLGGVARHLLPLASDPLLHLPPTSTGGAPESLNLQRGVSVSVLHSAGKLRTIPIIFGSQTLNVSGFRFTSYVSPRRPDLQVI